MRYRTAWAIPRTARLPVAVTFILAGAGLVTDSLLAGLPGGPGGGSLVPLLIAVSAIWAGASLLLQVLLSDDPTPPAAVADTASAASYEVTVSA